MIYLKEDLKSMVKKAEKNLLNHLKMSAYKAFVKNTMLGKMFKTVVDKINEVGLLNKDTAEELNKLVTKYLTEENINIIKLEFKRNHFKPKEEWFEESKREFALLKKNSSKFNEIYNKFAEFEKKIEQYQDEGEKIFKIKWEGKVYGIISIFVEWVKNGIFETDKKEYKYGKYGKIDELITLIANEVEDVENIKDIRNLDILKLVKFFYKNSETFKDFYNKNKEKRKIVYDLANKVKEKILYYGSYRYNKSNKKTNEDIKVIKSNYFFKYNEKIKKVIDDSLDVIKKDEKLLNFVKDIKNMIGKNLMKLNELKNNKKADEIVKKFINLIIDKYLYKFKVFLDLEIIAKNKYDFLIIVLFNLIKKLENNNDI